MLCDYILNLPEIAYLEKHGRPDLSARSNFSSYPSKMQSAVIRAMLSVAKIAPEKAARALGDVFWWSSGGTCAADRRRRM